MLPRLAAALSRFVARYVPNPFVFVIALTLVAFAAALQVGRPAGQGLVERAGELISCWYGKEGTNSGLCAKDGFAFALQMCLVLATGHALASAPIVRRGLLRLAAWPRTEPQAAFVTALVAILTAWLNWGFGLVAASIFAREVYRASRDRGERWAYPVLGAAAYSGLMVWHGGLSGSAPLQVAGERHAFVDIYGTVPIARTLGTPMNLSLCAIFLVGIPLLFAWIARSIVSAPDRGKVWSVPGDRAAPAAAPPAPTTPAERLDGSRLLTGAIVALAVGALWLLVKGKGIADAISLNSMIVLFLALGMALHGSPARYVAAIDEAAGELAGILLQFPFYFGILGLLAETGLGRAVADGAVGLARSAAAIGFPLETAWSWMTFLSASFLNLFVSSGGGLWSIQGGIAGESARALGLDPARAVMMVAYGDEYTNMVQPFWALPLLSITGLKAREILAYSILLTIAALPAYLLVTAVF